MRGLLPYELLFAIRLATRSALFAAHGYPPPVYATTVLATPLAAIAEALASPALPLPLCRALHTIAAFASWLRPWNRSLRLTSHSGPRKT